MAAIDESEQAAAWQASVMDETRRWTSSTWTLEDMQSELKREQAEWDSSTRPVQGAGSHRISANMSASTGGNNGMTVVGEMISPAVVDEGYAVEVGPAGVDCSHAGEYEIEEAENDVPHYAENFNGKPHKNYVGESSRGPAVVSIEAVDKEKKVLRALFRSKRGESRVVIQNGTFKAPFKDDSKALVQLRAQLADECGEVTFYEIRSPEDHASLEQNLVAYEQKVTMVQRYKFGVLYVRAGQTDENEWFNNNAPPQRFYDFMGMLGDKTQLVGHQGYSGGLNTREEVTGSHSYFTKFKGFEIMFHVSPMLPYFPLDTQQVERKRHLGNDVVLIVYRDVENPDRENRNNNTDMNVPFDPLLINSHFNHIFVVVQPEIGDPSRYRVSICTKAGVRPYGPELASSTFSTGAGLREWLLTKCVNGERSSMHAGEFVRLWSKTREITLKNLVDTFQSSGKKSKTGTVSKGSVKNFLQVVGNAKDTAEKASAAEAEVRRIAKSMVGSDSKLIFKDGRRYVFDGPVMKVCRKKNAPRHLFLFDDVLAHCSNATARDKFVLHKVYQCGTTQIKDMADTEQLKNAFQIITTEEKSFVVFTRSQQEKREWMQKFQQEVQMAKEAQEDAAAVWIPDSAAKECMTCRSVFTFTNRRHHCRSCGDVVCGACSKQKMAVSGGKKEVRVCKNCFRSKSGIGPVIKLESISSDDSQTKISYQTRHAGATVSGGTQSAASTASGTTNNSTVSEEYRPPGAVQDALAAALTAPGAKRGLAPLPKRAPAQRGLGPNRGTPPPKRGFAPKRTGAPPPVRAVAHIPTGPPPTASRPLVTRPTLGGGAPSGGAPKPALPKRGLAPLRRGPAPPGFVAPPVTAPPALAPSPPVAAVGAVVSAPTSMAPAVPGSLRADLERTARSYQPRPLRELLDEAERLGVNTEAAESKADVVLVLLQTALGERGVKDIIALCDELGLEEEAERANDKTELCALAARHLASMAE